MQPLAEIKNPVEKKKAQTLGLIFPTVTGEEDLSAMEEAKSRTGVDDKNRLRNRELCCCCCGRICCLFCKEWTTRVLSLPLTNLRILTFSFIREIMNDIRFDAVTNGFLGTFDETNTQDLT